MTDAWTIQWQLSSFLALILVCLMMANPVSSMPPHGDLVDRISENPEDEPYFLANSQELRERGIGRSFSTASESMHQRGKVMDQLASGEFRALVILAHFSDHPAQTSSYFYDSLVFGTTGSTVRDYYNEVSYGQLDIVSIDLPSDIGWQTAPQSYAFYVNGQNGTGAYPQNSQKLVEDLVDQVDGLVDFSQYDNDGDGTVDCLMIVHSGSGAEFSGDNNDIWSHEWAIAPRYRDGVAISTFTMQPEYWSHAGDMTIGVFCHELGHGLGLPDLYDTDYTSNGIGKWGLMSYGSWLGPRGMGSSPAHLTAWCKAQIGFIEPINVTTNQSNESIPNAALNPTAYRLWYGGGASDEYFLIENRQKTGYDSYLPGSGLLIWHIDEARSGNFLEWYPGMNNSLHALVALEQADGNYDLEKRSDAGDMTDPFPGPSGATAFNATSEPSSDSYTEGNSFVAVDGITSNGPEITANLIVGFAASHNEDDPTSLPTTISLANNYPNPFNPATTIGFSVDEGSQAQLEVFNCLGRKVTTILNGPIPAGQNEITWTAVDDHGRELSSGVYFYRLSINGQQQTKKMLLLR